jgi:hypothetical protein
MDKVAHEETASQWGGSIGSFTSSERSHDSNEAAADADHAAEVYVEPDAPPQHAHEQPRADELPNEAKVGSMPTGSHERTSRSMRTSLQRMTGSLQQTLLRMNEGQ